MVNVVQAPTDGRALVLFFDSTEVQVPATGERVLFSFEFQPPHADGLFKLSLRGAPFPGLIWGSHTHWSPNGRYLVAEWTGVDLSSLRRGLVLIDLQDGGYVDCGGFMIHSIDNDGIHGKDGGSAGVSIRFAEQVMWRAV